MRIIRFAKSLPGIVISSATGSVAGLQCLEASVQSRRSRSSAGRGMEATPIPRQPIGINRLRSDRWLPKCPCSGRSARCRAAARARRCQHPIGRRSRAIGHRGHEMHAQPRQADPDTVRALLAVSGRCLLRHAARNAAPGTPVQPAGIWRDCHWPWSKGGAERFAARARIDPRSI